MLARITAASGMAPAEVPAKMMDTTVIGIRAVADAMEAMNNAATFRSHSARR